jgi:two-component system response regulator MprA
VLVVDDDEDIRDAMVMLLDLKGYAAASAADGLDALEQIRTRGSPGVVLLDLRMPRMYGEEFISAVHADPALGPPPIVLMSGDSNAREVATALGVQSFLKKPIELSDLVATVARFVHNGGRDSAGVR